LQYRSFLTDPWTTFYTNYRNVNPPVLFSNPPYYNYDWLSPPVVASRKLYIRVRAETDVSVSGWTENNEADYLSDVSLYDYSNAYIVAQYQEYGVEVINADADFVSPIEVAYSTSPTGPFTEGVVNSAYGYVYDASLFTPGETYYFQLRVIFADGYGPPGVVSFIMPI
jgi:hypothetical protein